MKLLAYISDKDLFAEFYRKKLARRLLFDRSASDEHERLILTRLKQQCGAQFTSKVCNPTLCISVFFTRCLSEGLALFVATISVLVTCIVMGVAVVGAAVRTLS